MASGCNYQTFNQRRSPLAIFTKFGYAVAQRLKSLELLKAEAVSAEREIFLKDVEGVEIIDAKSPHEVNQSCN